MDTDVCFVLRSPCPCLSEKKTSKHQKNGFSSFRAQPHELKPPYRNSSKPGAEQIISLAPEWLGCTDATRDSTLTLPLLRESPVPSIRTLTWSQISRIPARLPFHLPNLESRLRKRVVVELAVLEPQLRCKVVCTARWLLMAVSTGASSKLAIRLSSRTHSGGTKPTVEGASNLSVGTFQSLAASRSVVVSPATSCLSTGGSKRRYEV